MAQNGIHAAGEDADNDNVPPMGMTSQHFQAAATSTISEIAAYYDSLSNRPVLPSISPGYLKDLIPASPPQHPEAWSAIQADIDTKILPGVTHWQSPNFMAFFPASSTYPGILGEMWSAALTAPAFNWLCSPACTELETIVLDWVAQMLALPPVFTSTGTGGGVIQGSASEAIVVAVVAARERLVRRTLEKEGNLSEEEKEDRMCQIRSKLVALGSNHSHSSTQKAAIIAGTRYRSVETYKRDNFAMRGENLRQKLDECKAKGLVPYYLTVTLGTTNTCAIDDFAEIAAVKQDYPDLWIHVDAAYAGAALVCPEYQHLTTHFTAFDSFDMNMHKWLLTNFDASCMFVQNRRDLTDALSITPSYLRNQFSDQGLVTDYRDWQIPLGRRFRALKIWFVLRTYGVRGLQAHIRRHVALGDMFADLVRRRADLFDILVPPAFALTVLTVKPRRGENLHLEQNNAVNGRADLRPDQDSHLPVLPKQDDEELKAGNGVTKAVYELVDSRREIFLTSSVVAGTYAIRVVSANPLADEEHLRRAFEILVEAAEEVLSKQD